MLEEHAPWRYAVSKVQGLSGFTLLVESCLNQVSESLGETNSLSPPNEVEVVVNVSAFGGWEVRWTPRGPWIHPVVRFGFHLLSGPRSSVRMQ